MHLSKLTIQNFRKIAAAEIDFVPGLNILVGPNNTGKTAIIDSLRALLGGHDEPFPRITIDDATRTKEAPSGPIQFDYVFDGLTPDDEADFMHAFKA